MAGGTRQIKRGARGRFAGSSSGGKVETIKSSHGGGRRVNTAAAAQPKKGRSPSGQRRFTAKRRRQLSGVVTVGVTAAATAGSFAAVSRATNSRLLGVAVAANLGLAAGSTTAHAARVAIGMTPTRAARAKSNNGKRIKR